MPRVPSSQADLAQNAILAVGTNYYMSLHTADPGTTGASEGGEGRQVIQFGASSGGSMASNTSTTWPTAVGGTYTHFGVWTAATSGTYKRGGQLVPSASPPTGSQIQVPAGSIVFVAS